MANFDNISKKLDCLFTALYAPLALLFISLLIRNLINYLIFPSVPREGPLFWFQLWANNLYMIFWIGFVGFVILLLSQLFRQYIMSPPFDISRLSELEDLNKGDVNRVFYRVLSPIIMVLVGAFIPPVFGGWGYYMGGAMLSVNKSNITDISNNNSEIILSVLPNVGGITEFFEYVPSQEGKILFVILTGLTVVSMWNLSYLSQIYWYHKNEIKGIADLPTNFIKWLTYAGLIALFLMAIIDILKS